MADIKRYEGTVKWFNGQKGYGFIDPEDGSSDDLFVHQSEIKVKGFRFLRDGQRVEFSVHSGEDGRKKAMDVVGLGRTKRYQPRPRYGGHGIRGSYGRYGGESSDEGHGMRNWRFGRGGRGGGDGVGNPQCYNCGRFGHFARNCYECSDHGCQDYDNSSGRGNGRGSGRGHGHSHSRGSDGQSGTCFRCGEEGHFARECPNDQIN